MENCTIYSHTLNFDRVIELVKDNLPKAKVESKENGLEKSLTATLKGGLFGKDSSLTINYRERKTPSYKLDKIECGLSQNLAGMVNFIQQLPAKNENIRDKFLYKVMSANCEMPFMAEPAITPDFETILRKIAIELDAFIFAQPGKVFSRSDVQHFTDKNLNLIIDTKGNCEIDDLTVNVAAKYHDQPKQEYTQEQINRKNKSEFFLAEKGIKVNKNLPCTPSANEVAIRNLNEVIERAYALLVIAAKGEGVEQQHLERVVKEKNIKSFSPYEKYIYESKQLDDQERAYATWRYESLYVMLWALGKTSDLKYPAEICDVPAIVELIFQPSREEFSQSAVLRSASEILDELDKTYRMNWACVDARIKNDEIGGGIDSGIIYERHYALNWLTNYQNQEWDNVRTDT
jgi:hypothetical protein